MLKQGKVFLLLLMASLLAMPFPCAFACGLEVSTAFEAEKPLEIEKIRTCHSQKVEISVAQLALPGGANFSRPAPNNCPILFSLNQGWSHSLVVAKASDAHLKETLYLGVISLAFFPMISIEQMSFSMEDSKDPPLSTIPIYLINPVLRV